MEINKNENHSRFWSVLRRKLCGKKNSEKRKRKKVSFPFVFFFFPVSLGKRGKKKSETRKKNIGNEKKIFDFFF
jgi:hypothetical protein